MTVAIGDLGLVGDTRSAALVAPDGAIEWWCLPRFDAPPVFGRLVGGPDAGHFVVQPDGPRGPAVRQYVDDTTTLATTWSLDGGELRVRDSMVAEVSGRLMPGTVLVRRLTANGGPVPVRVEFRARFGYGRAPARRVTTHGGAVVLEHGGLALGVLSDAPQAIVPDRDVRFTVMPDRPVTIVVTAAHRGPAVLVPPAVAAEAASRDEDGWRRWIEGARLPTRHRDVTARSLLTLRLLTYAPSGAPVAAPTTSLPEAPGGDRNWDYRYAWPRDAALGVAALLAAGKDHEARAFLGWLLHASRLARPRLPVLFTLDGRRGPDERVLDGWPGYAGSVPVRVGNGATTQHQLDGYGWVLDAAWSVARGGGAVDGETWRAMADFADHVADSWHEPDAGIWERRDDPRHHVHSKVMAWVALDRAVRLAATRRGRRPARRASTWRAARDAVAADVRARGWDGDAGTYVGAYGSHHLDAALLLLPSTGFDGDADAHRMASTVEAIRARLGAGGPLLYRYDGPDGLAGREGAFLPCSFWLVSALARLGRRDEAAAVFDDLVSRGGPLGLFAEEADPASGAQLGNFPQALTHASLLLAAYDLDALRPSARG